MLCIAILRYMRILASRKKKILEIIEKGSAHGYRIADELQIPLSSVYEHLRDLREHGLIQARQQGRRRIYRLTEKGKLLLKALG